MQLIVVGGIVILIVALDRSALWAESRGWIYWRRHGGAKAGGASGLFDGVQTLIVPSNRHSVEEKARQEMSRQDVSAADGAIGVDTDSGVVRLRMVEKSEP